MNILIVRLSSLGDIIHTYPMLFDIKTNLNNCSIDWLIDSDFTNLVELNPLIDNVISIPLRSWLKNKTTLLIKFFRWRKLQKQQLGNKYYDYIIDSQGLLKSAILTTCFNGTVVGLGRNSIKEKLATLFYQRKYEVGKQHLAITKNRLLASNIFNYKINVNEVNFGLLATPNIIVKKIINSLRRSNLSTNKYVIFFHATSKDSKKYPLDKWASLANYLINLRNFDVILPFGNEKERSESVQLQQMITTDIDHVIIPQNRLNYSELTPLILNAEFIFGVDTGLVHLANALNKKLIAIYLDTDPSKTGIYTSNRAKNIGGIGQIPNIQKIISLFDNIMKV